MTAVRASSLAPLLVSCLLVGGCKPDRVRENAAKAFPSAVVPVPAVPSASSSLASPTSPSARARVHEGSVLALSFAGDALFVADEDHKTLRVVPLPLGDDAAVRAALSVSLPGPPAQIVALERLVLVTVRDPGLLLTFERRGGFLVETGRLSLPVDAWGVAVSPDEETAVVTSAWSARVSIVKIKGLEKLATLEVSREPRAVVVRADGAAAYVTHLTSGKLTRIDLTTRTAAEIVLPPAPLRAPMGVTLSGSLGYAAVLSPDGRRLFAARHAVGAHGHEAWFGASSVDVLLTSTDTPASPRWYAGSPKQKSLLASQVISGGDVERPGAPLGAFTQPRAIVYRATTRSVVVASEGDDALVELDAISPSPTDARLRTYPIGRDVDPVGTHTRGGAPAGIALALDETKAWVFCRSTYDLAEIALDQHRPEVPFKPEPPRLVRLADDPLGGDAANGRRVFYSAKDKITSGGLACAGCHPEGRDDGQVWHEAVFTTADGDHANFVGHEGSVPKEARRRGFPRRTPLLAGRVAAKGPYGWHGENADIVARLRAGFGLHRWGGVPPHEDQNLTARALYVVPFVRTGLAEPPREARDATDQEKRGKAIFASERTRCATCHAPDLGFTDRVSYPLPMLPVRPGFDREEKTDFKTPSLIHLKGRAPYFHDGSAASLSAMIEGNNDRMGKTAHLSADERAALVAYLETL